MPARSEFVEYVLELMAPLGAVRARAMFGGWGVYLDDRMFALVADDTLYFKTDDENRTAFESQGCEPFTYIGNGKPMVMSYHHPPVDALDDAEELCRWARFGVEAAARAAAKKDRKVKPRTVISRGGRS